VKRATGKALMARSHETGAVVQAWVSPELAREIKQLADRDRRTVSSLIRFTLEDRLEAETHAAEGKGQ
jgi:predicted transcriptional regulator